MREQAGGETVGTHIFPISILQRGTTVQIVFP
jgi:hypothetical protein